MGGAWLLPMRNLPSIRRRSRPAIASLVGLVGVIGALPLEPAAAEPSGGQPAAATPSISPQVALVPVDSAAFRDASAAVSSTGTALDTARSIMVEADARLVRLSARDGELTALVGEATARRDAAATDFDEARDALRAIAVASYVRGTEIDPIEVLFDQERGTQIEGEGMLIETVTDGQVRRLDEARARRDGAARTVEEASADRDDVRAGVVETTVARDAAAADDVRLTARLVVDRATLEEARALATVVGADLPLVALDAYHRAAASLAGEQPRCGLPWWALAGIGKVESRHGSYRGTAPRADGNLARPIVGIPLDGTNSTRLIEDTDGGVLDGDTVVDRAVGPVQFIPTTWARWGRDGNDDGVEDPQNLYDAALGAGAYLCGAAPLDTDDDLRRAFLRYNVSESYAADVLGFALGYSSVVIPPS